MIERKKTRAVQVGHVTIGGNAPIVIQSMCNTDTRDVEATAAQILRLEEAGCAYPPHKLRLSAGLGILLYQYCQ